MKRYFLLISLILIQLISLSQAQFQKIKISNDLELIKLSDNAYVHVSYSIIGKLGRVSSNGLILTSDSSAFLFDTPSTDSLTRVLITHTRDLLNKLN